MVDTDRVNMTFWIALAIAGLDTALPCIFDVIGQAAGIALWNKSNFAAFVHVLDRIDIALSIWKPPNIHFLEH
jgi:hypothetical protein